MDANVDSVLVTCVCCTYEMYYVTKLLLIWKTMLQWVDQGMFNAVHYEQH